MYLTYQIDTDVIMSDDLYRYFTYGLPMQANNGMNIEKEGCILTDNVSKRSSKHYYSPTTVTLYKFACHDEIYYVFAIVITDVESYRCAYCYNGKVSISKYIPLTPHFHISHDDIYPSIINLDHKFTLEYTYHKEKYDHIINLILQIINKINVQFDNAIETIDNININLMKYFTCGLKLQIENGLDIKKDGCELIDTSIKYNSWNIDLKLYKFMCNDEIYNVLHSIIDKNENFIVLANDITIDNIDIIKFEQNDFVIDNINTAELDHDDREYLQHIVDYVGSYTRLFEGLLNMIHQIVHQ